VDLNLSFLAASPDGLIGNDILVEIKCPASVKTLSPKEGITLKKIKNCNIENGQPSLKRNDNYFTKSKVNCKEHVKYSIIFVFRHLKVIL
jgi:hypothetical protein